jgi:Flp pilus assembly protein TadD
MYREGIAEFEKMSLISPGDTEAVSDLGYAYALTGRRAEAQKLLDQLKGVSKRKYVPAGSIAQIYVAFGEKDDAFDGLEKAYNERSLGFEEIKVNPIFDPLRSDPRFADLLRRMNLQQ